MHDTLADHINQLQQFMLENKAQLALAESCTGGLFSNLCTQHAGASRWFCGAAVVYSNQCKQQLLQVKPDTLERFGAVSQEVAKEMAMGALKNLNADFAISTTGIAGPDGGSREKPVGTVFVGVASLKQQHSLALKLAGNRLQIQQQSIMLAVNYFLTTFTKI